MTLIRHPFFGPLTYEPELNWYVGRISYNETPLKINFNLKGSNIEALTAQAQTFLDSDAFVNALINGLEALLVIKNNAWLDDTEAPFVLEELYGFIVIDAIVFACDTIELYSLESDLFWGNRARISIDYHNRLRTVEVEEDAMDEE